MPDKHVFVSAVADGADATLIQPSDWNDYHVSPYATGSFTLATGLGGVQVDLLQLVDTDEATLEGTAALVVL